MENNGRWSTSPFVLMEVISKLSTPHNRVNSCNTISVCLMASLLFRDATLYFIFNFLSHQAMPWNMHQLSNQYLLHYGHMK
jgi:hypothetical protein